VREAENWVDGTLGLHETDSLTETECDAPVGIAKFSLVTIIGASLAYLVSAEPKD